MAEVMMNMAWQRWTFKRKAALLDLIDVGAADPADYGITLEELAEWRAGRASDGLRGLKVSTLGERRRPAAAVRRRRARLAKRIVAPTE